MTGLVVVIVVVWTIGTRIGYKLCFSKDRNHHVTGLDAIMPDVYHNRNKQVAVLRIQRKLTALLEAAGCEAWIAYGTLLGHQRHGGIIPWDDDIDLAIRRSDLRSLWERRNEFRGLGSSRYHEEMIKLEELLCDPRKTHADLFSCRRRVMSRNGEVRWQIEHPLFNQDYFVESQVFPLRRESLQGVVRVMVPRNPDDFLNRNFGRDWRRKLYVRPTHNKPWACMTFSSLIRGRTTYTMTDEIGSVIDQIVGEVAEKVKDTKISPPKKRKFDNQAWAISGGLKSEWPPKEQLRTSSRRMRPRRTPVLESP